MTVEPVNNRILDAAKSIRITQRVVNGKWNNRQQNIPQRNV